MNSYLISENNITPEEYLFLRNEASWGNPSLEDISHAINNSLIIFTVRKNKRICGCIRIVGDGRLCFYIQDLIVAKNERGKGLARLLFNAVMQYLEKHAAIDAFVGLMSAKGIETLYKSYGFFARPTDDYGPGMIQFWKRGDKNWFYS